MNFDLTDEQEMIQRTARDFTQAEVRPCAAQIDREDAFPDDLYRRMAELGLLGMTLPADYGGAGADTVSWSIVQEELARGSAALADSHNVCKLMSDIILSNGTDHQRAHYLPRMAAGEAICAIAQTEPDAGSDVASVRTTARAVDGGFVINGTKQFITFAGNCHLAIVVATTDRSLSRKGIALFLVDAENPGFCRGAKSAVLGVRGLETGELVFKDCFVPETAVLARSGEGLKRALASLTSGRIGMAAESVGIAQAALDASIAYARTRHAFGQPIGEFQAIRFMIADMSMNVEAARLMVRRAAYLKDRGRPVIREASEAKLFASELANRAATDALQIHGAYGYSAECEVERLFRDARVYQIWEGTSQIQRMIIGRQLFADA